MGMMMMMLMLLLVVVVTDKNDVVKCHTFKIYSLMLFLSPQKLGLAPEAQSESQEMTFLHRSFYTEKLLHRSLHTEQLLHTGAFTHTQRSLYAPKLLHKFTQSSPYLHTKAFTHRLFTHRGATVPQKLIARCWTERFSKLGPDSS